MVQQVNVDKLVQETRKYEFADGLRDIQLGVFMIFSGWIWFVIFQPAWFRFLIMMKDQPHSWIAMAVGILILFVPAITGFVMNRMIEKVRRRWLWRESGMIKSSQMVGGIQNTILASILLVAVIVIGLRLQPLMKTGEFYIWSMFLMATGWSFGVTLVGLGKRINEKRYVTIGLLGGIASTALLLYQTSMSGAGVVFYLGWGVILLSSGIMVLRRVWPVIEG